MKQQVLVSSKHVKSKSEYSNLFMPLVENFLEPSISISKDIESDEFEI